MSLTGGITLDGFFVSHSGSPAVATFKSFQYTLLTRGEDIRRQPGISVQDNLNNTPNTCAFTVDGGAPTPQVGEKIEITDAEDLDANNLPRRLFAGTVQSVEQIYEGQISQVAWRVTCIDFTWLFNRRRPFGQWINQSVSKVVQDLVSRYAPGFTTTDYVQTNLAKVTVTLDGSKDMVSVFNELAAAIGGGHWYVDYDQKVHFFHVVPAGLEVPIGPQPTNYDHMTVAMGGAVAKNHDYGYYLFRHSFIYSDGSESQLRAVSNLVKSNGAQQFVFTGIPLGTNLGTVTCTGRRVYYNKFIIGFPGGESIEQIHGFCQINDNTTTGFTTNFGATAASVATIAAFGGAFARTYSTPLITTPVNPGRPGALPDWVQLSDQAASLNLAGGISNGTYGNPFATVDPPTSAGSVLTGVGSIPAGWTPGSTIYYAYTYTNLLGETTMGAQGTVALNSGLRFLAPNIMATGASNLVLYISDDNVTFHDIGAGLFPGQGVNFITPRATWLTFPSAPVTNDAHIYIPRGWAGWNGTNFIAEGAWLQPVPGSNIVYFATADVAAALENAVINAQGGNALPKLAFAGHLPAPATAMTGSVDTVFGSGYWNGISIQFKYAFLYRDGSVSFPSPATPTLLQRLIKGQGLAGFQLANIATGPTVDGNEVVARLIYWSTAGLSNPNYSINYAVSDGFEWPVPFLDPNWSGGTTGGVGIIPNNTATTLADVSLVDLDTSYLSHTGISCGRGNVPYGNAAQAVLSLDPIPIWPNPDGPFLEDVNPPDDIDDLNDDLLHEDSGSQPFSMTTDLSQIRNRVIVVGSGSVVTADAKAGDLAVYVADVTAFSPSGGTVKYNDVGTGAVVQFKYTGVQGVPGNAAITLSTALTQRIPQGTNIANYFVAEDLESQKFLAKVELDKDGLVTDGIHEYTIVDTSLKAVFQLFMRAYAELELFSKPIITVRYATRDPKSRSGQTVHVDLTSPPCLGDFLIQQVQIDQIHDESDQLLPRYTVTASSSKFDLNDLLLKIIGGDLGTGGSGNSSAGIVASGIAQSTSSTAAIGLPNPTLSRKFTSWAIHKAASADTIGGGINTGFNSTGSSAAQNDIYPGVGGISSYWIRYLPVNNNANLCGVSLANGTLWEYRPKFIARFRTCRDLFNVATNSHRCYWVGLGANPGNLSGGVITYTVPHVALVCLDPASNGGSWQTSSLVAGNGSTQVQSNQGFAPMLPNTHYRVTITAGLTSASFFVEDLTRNLTYSASVNVAAFTSDQIPGTTNDEFNGFIYGSATIMAGETVVGAGGLDIGAAYQEID
jgi:hypothetical protein